MIHELKCWPDPFQRIDQGIKTHEVRKPDRDYQVGDVLHLREWDPRPKTRTMGTRGYTGSELYVRVTYISMPGTCGLPADVCVMSIRVIEADEAGSE